MKVNYFWTGFSIIILLIVNIPTLSAQDFALKRLNDSPRHQEWVKIPQGDRTVQAFQVFPEVKDKAPAVIIIHENRGLTDWVRSMADQVAEAGYIAIAPDLLSGMGPNHGKTSDFPNQHAATEALYQLSPKQVTADLMAVAGYVTQQEACNGKIAVAGFCWGGKQTFDFAVQFPTLSAAFVFYGTAPEDAGDIAKISCPVYGFYGENDARITAAVPKVGERMKTANKKYEPVIYDGAGHGFMRSGEEPNAEDANKKARNQAWERWREILKKL